MTDQELINLIINAINPIDIFSDPKNWQPIYKDYIKQIHSDRCSHPKAVEASMKLNTLRDILIKGEVYKDDAGDVKYFYDHVEFVAEKNMLKHSFNNYQLLKNLKGEIADELNKRLPENVEFSNDKLIFKFNKRALPLSQLIKKYNNIEQKHVNWILSRMLEFSSLLNRLGFIHAGITPDSIFVVPETHGIYCTSFYHLTKINEKLTTISSRYKFFYPSNVFTEKLAKEEIDIDLCKRTAIYLLGDISGSGVKLKKNIKPEILQFLMKSGTNSYNSYLEWREILKKNFKSEFIPFNI